MTRINDIAKKDSLSDRAEHLIERDSDPISFPDKLYGIGGGGRKMVIEMFSQDWVAIEALKNRQQDIDIVLIDTAGDKGENHYQEIRELKTNLNALEQLLQDQTGRETNIGSINVEDVLVSDYISIRNQASLTGNEVRDTILDQTDADHWWILPEHVSAVDQEGSLYEVSKGAIKRRALGKALHYKALTESREYSQAFSQNVSEDEIALFVGLGGGTGSGTFIDIAKEIRKNNQAADISLFATTPASTQRDEALANAFAALTELEYMSLSDNSPINSIYLFPLEPTGLDREATDDPDAIELDRAMIYAVLGTYNSKGDFELSDESKHSPFTIVVPQLLHYSREEVNEKTKTIYEHLQLKRKLLNTERKNVKEIEEYLDDNYPHTGRVAGTELSEEAQTYLQNRLRRLERLIDSDLLEKLDEIEVVDNIRENILQDIYGDGLSPGEAEIEEVIRRRGWGEVTTDIEFIVDRQNISDGPVDNYTELENEFIKSIINTELSRFTQVYNLLCRLEKAKREKMGSSGSQVSTDADIKLIESLIVPTFGRQTESRRYKTLTTEIEKLEEEADENRRKANEIEQQLEDEKDAREQQIEAAFNESWSELRPLVEDYRKIKTVEDKIDISELSQALRTFKTDIEDGLIDTNSDEQIRSVLTQIDQQLSVSFDSKIAREKSISVPEENVNDAINKLKLARERWDELEESTDESSGILGSIIGGNNDEPTQIDPSGYRQPYNEVTNTGVFDIPSPPNMSTALNNFTVSVTIDTSQVTKELQDLKNDLEDQIESIFESKINSLSDDSDNMGFGSESSNVVVSEEAREFVESVRTDSTTNWEEPQQVLKERIASEVTSDADQYEKELREIKTKLNELTERQELLNAGLSVYTSVRENETLDPLNSIYEEYTDYDRFGRDIYDLPHERTRRHGIDGLYKHNVTPVDLSSAVEEPSLAQTGLLERSPTGEAPQERQDIQRSLRRIVSNKVLNEDYNDIKERRLSTSNKTFYEGTGVYISYIGEVFDNNKDRTHLTFNDMKEAEVKDQIINDFALNDPGNQYDAWVVQNGDPWQVAMCVYIQGIPFRDNLFNLNANNGYRSRYLDKVRGGDPIQTVKRHAFGLENGFYAVRRDRIDIDQNPGFYLEQNPDQIEEELLDRYETPDVTQDVEPTKEN